LKALAWPRRKIAARALVSASSSVAFQWSRPMYEVGWMKKTAAFGPGAGV